MRHPRRSAIAGATLFAALLLAVPACSSDSSSDEGGASTTAAADSGELVGTFEVTAGECASGAVTAGSYFRMVQSGGTAEAGPFVPNADSSCTDASYSVLLPGTDGGLVTGSFQEQPDPPFDASQNGLADMIVQPLKFFGVNFAASTNPTDPQSGESVPAPSIRVVDGELTGDLAAMTVAWNGQEFNQGAPKPDGSMPGLTAAPTGTYDPATGAFVLEWTSQIVGGPFDGFTGVWHLEGTFTAG